MTTFIPIRSGADATENDRDRSSADWFRSAVVYQVYPRSFADSDGDGIGDLGGVLSKLDYLESLGVDVVWLSPIYRSPQADNGYDISDYQAVDPLFGTMQQLDELIAGLHARGMKLLMDLVVNHTSDEHEWFTRSRSSRTDAKRDWYVWRDPRDGGEPNNWASFFSGSAWTLDDTTGQYYLHLFGSKQPDLNWENAELRSAVYQMMRWWLDRGVDGFRMDVINFISKVQTFEDVPSVPGQPYGDAFSLFADGPRVHEFLREMREQVFSGRVGGFLTVGEMPGTTVEQAVLYTDPSRHEVDMVFQFDHVDVDHGVNKWDYIGLDRVALKRSMHHWQTGLAERGWNSLYWNNHDQPRAVSRFGDDDPAYWAASAKALGTILHGMRGTPYIYQGEELGMTNFPFASADAHQDIEALNHWRHVLECGLDQNAALAGLRAAGRDNARTPMQWNGSPHAGFTTGVPWLPVNDNHRWLNVATQLEDDRSVLAHYAALIKLRHTLPILAEGDFTPLHEHDPHIWAYTRATLGQRLLVVANCSRIARCLDVDETWLGARLVLANREGSDSAVRGRSLLLEAWDARIYLTDVSRDAGEGAGDS